MHLCQAPLFSPLERAEVIHLAARTCSHSRLGKSQGVTRAFALVMAPHALMPSRASTPLHGNAAPQVSPGCLATSIGSLLEYIVSPNPCATVPGPHMAWFTNRLGKHNSLDLHRC